MRFDERVTLVIETIKPGTGLDDNRVVKSYKNVPCYPSDLSHNEQMGLFGSYRLGSFKLHLQGKYESVKEIIYHGDRRKVQGKRYHAGVTVIFV
ncbi:MAG: hypothetical protein Q4A67_07180 [Aerococcus sp.]|nr:hypothetical protein [Aerococcus sp.]